VHARRGERSAYQPLRSSLCASTDPVRVALALLERFPVCTIYIADLDAITGDGDNTTVLRRLLASCPGVETWLDAGFRRPEDLEFAAGYPHCRPVIAAEVLAAMRDYEALCARCDRPVLSLDFRNADFLGPPTLLLTPQLWPRDVVVMTLDRVGGGEGPDNAAVSRITGMAAGRRTYAAGGVRHAADLVALQAAGAAGALVATALHDGGLTAADLHGPGCEARSSKKTAPV